jgi:tRNA uridine 5-carboxymethylaminomethyl modification enzyme
LTVRQDNALERLGEIAFELGLYNDTEADIFNSRLAESGRIRETANATSIAPELADPLLQAAGTTPISHSVKVVELARRHGLSLAELFKAAGVTTEFSSDAMISAELEIKYAGYFDRERAQAERIKLMGDFPIPGELAYATMNSLSHEARQKLATVKPRTLAQAARIPGVSPSDIQNLVIEVERRRVASTVS